MSRGAASRAEGAVFKAIADPTRRAILDLLRDGPRTVGELAARFPVTRFAIRKHLQVLHRARLVVVRPQGRERWNHLNAVPIQTVYERWAAPYQRAWAGRLTQFRQHIEGEAAMPRKPVPSELARVELEIDIAAAPSRVWSALVDRTTLWWPKDFYTGPAKGFHMEPRIGGRVYEDWGDGAGVVWYQVFGMNPGVSLDLQGCMAVPYGPALTLLHLELAARGKGTRLAVSDTTIGVVGDPQEKTDGWRKLFGEALKRFVEKKA